MCGSVIRIARKSEEILNFSQAAEWKDANDATNINALKTMKTKKSFVENNDENDKRVNDHFTVACVNAFAVDCANNLNAIRARSERGLEQIEKKMETMERSLRFLEKKLERFEEEEEGGGKGEAVKTPPLPLSPSSAERDEPPDGEFSPHLVKEGTRADEDGNDDEKKKEEGARRIRVNPAHEKYHKMLRLGVPEQAVRNKMKLDGVDERDVVFLQ